MSITWELTKCSLDRYQQQGGSCTPQGGPPSYPRTQESLTVPSVGSPPSAAPSPLPNPHSQPPSDIPPGEQTMPTLSPHPPAALPLCHSPVDTKPPITPSEPPKSQDSQVPYYSFRLFGAGLSLADNFKWQIKSIDTIIETTS